jgi:hypothetical protein
VSGTCHGRKSRKSNKSVSYATCARLSIGCLRKRIARVQEGQAQRVCADVWSVMFNLKTSVETEGLVEAPQRRVSLAALQHYVLRNAILTCGTRATLACTAHVSQGFQSAHHVLSFSRGQTCDLPSCNCTFCCDQLAVWLRLVALEWAYGPCYQGKRARRS